MGVDRCPVTPLIAARRKVFKTPSDRRIVGKSQQPRPDQLRDLARRYNSGGAQHPIALLVELADHARAARTGKLVKLCFDLVLQQGAFFFDDKDFLEVSGERKQTGAVQRPTHADFEDANAERCRPPVVDAEGA